MAAKSGGTGRQFLEVPEQGKQYEQVPQALTSRGGMSGMFHASALQKKSPAQPWGLMAATATHTGKPFWIGFTAS